jgi:predicted ATP-binding protein involved in virulence
MEKVDIRLDKLVLRNYKGFYTGDDENGVEITFDENLTVLIGDNGSGKSAVLDAIALFLGKLRSEITNVGETASVYPFPMASNEKKNKDVNNETQSSKLDAFFNLQPQLIWENENEDVKRIPKIGFTIEMLKAQSPSKIDDSKWYDHSKIGIEEFDNNTNDKKTLDYFLQDNIHDPLSTGEFKDLDKSVPVLVFYGANSINTDTSGELDEVENTVFDTYGDALDANKFSFKQFFVWFDYQQKREAQSIWDTEAEKDNITQSQIKFVADAIKDMLNDNTTEYKNLRVDWSRYPIEMVLTKKNKKTEIENKLLFSQLSSGERTLIALIADLTRRLCLANPNAKNPLDGNGIVLIDEIDVHLHPKWQQKVVTKLREVFPNIQFVVTTHSPLVVTNLPDENFKVYRLRDNGVEKFDKVRGMRLIEIFYNLYDTPERPLGIKEEIDKLFEAIDEDDEKTAHERLKELKKVLSEDDPAIIEAETSLKYMNV